MTDFKISDGLRLEWLQEYDGGFYNIDRITSIKGKGFMYCGSNSENWRNTLEEAIDDGIECTLFRNKFFRSTRSGV